MFALPGILGLLVSIYVRPHELYAELRDYNFLYFWLALTVVGVAVDVRAGRIRLASTPMLPYALAFWAWCLITLASRAPDLLPKNGVAVTVCVVLYLVLSYPSQQLSTYLRMTMVIFSLVLFFASVGADQGVRPFQCVVMSIGDDGARAFGDDRECAYVDEDGAPHPALLDCMSTGQPGIIYGCERVGLFGTVSIGAGRVRYLGVLEDPNDLALATAMSLPFAFAFYQMRRNVVRLAVLVVTVTIIMLEIVFTQSRGGQLTFAAVLGAYFVERFGWKRGAVVGAVLAGPMLLWGGRSDESADGSTMERLGCACAGIKMLMAEPIRGVGYSQYLEHHGQTAHNAYILAAGELGLVGMWLFGFIIYLAIKVPVTVLRLPMSDDHESRVIKTMAMAVLASLAGGAVGIYFLSWTYHYVLWIHLGLSGGLFGLVKRRHPGYECRLRPGEAARIAVGYVIMLVVWSQYIKYKNAWD
jgi:hypothetical protein